MEEIQNKKDHIFLKGGKALGKVLVSFILLYIFVNFIFANNYIMAGINLFVTIFISIPTIYLLFLKQKLSTKYPKLAKFWKIYRVIYVVLVISYTILWCVSIWHLGDVDKTQKTIDFINSQKITLDDVMGENLPPVPDQKINDSTIAGIDVNKNYIRDDVELAIFKKYPNSAKIRAAELQYAQAQQLELTQVRNSDTLVASMKKSEKAYFCFGRAVVDKNLPILEASRGIDQEEKELDKLLINTDLRKQKQSDIFEKYMKGHTLPSDNYCDVEQSSLAD